jgi:hypothetical protein
MSIGLWDFLFYASFGFVVTSSVAIAGVLLVFFYLFVPSVGAMLYSESIGKRLAIGWSMGTLVSRGRPHVARPRSADRADNRLRSVRRWRSWPPPGHCSSPEGDYVNRPSK